MTMDQDWLDSRIAAENYLPDDGFTARVVGRLPKHRQPIISLRFAILGCAGLLAFWLFLWQLTPVLASARNLQLPTISVNNPSQLAAYLQQPMVLLRGLAFAAVLGVAAVPFLRRWV